MAGLQNVIRSLPEPVKKVLRPIRNCFIQKHNSELSFWRKEFISNNRKFVNSDYGAVMLAMAEESDVDFLRGKVVADFGCGPRGSLVWASSALLRIGIDVLADRYADEFTETIISHQMLYVKSTEKVIPLPSEFVDIMFTLNAMDHVDSFPEMCNEIIRVMSYNGEFIGSFNLEEPSTPCEPQQLSEEIINHCLLDNLRLSLTE